MLRSLLVALATVALAAPAQAQVLRAWVASWQSARVRTLSGSVLIDDRGAGFQVSFPGDGTNGLALDPAGCGLVVSLPSNGPSATVTDFGQLSGTISFPNGGSVSGSGPDLTVSFPTGQPPIDLSDTGGSGLEVSFPSSGSPEVVVDPIPGSGLVVSIPGGTGAWLPTAEGPVSLPGGASIVVYLPANTPFGVCPNGGPETTVSFPNGTWIQAPVGGYYAWRRVSGAMAIRRVGQRVYY